MRLRRKRLTVACAAACGCLGIALLGVLLASASPSGVTVARSSGAALSSALQRAGLRPGTQFTPVTASTLTVPEPVAGSDGRTHLAYELLLLNVTAMPVRISQVEVQDATTHQALLNLTGAALTAAFTPVGGPAGTSPPTTRPPARRRRRSRRQRPGLSGWTCRFRRAKRCLAILSTG